MRHWLSFDGVGNKDDWKVVWLYKSIKTVKTTLSIAFVEEHSEKPYFRNSDRFLVYVFCDAGSDNKRMPTSILKSLLQHLIGQLLRLI
jgi:hypothetical protein